jgi:hypothetical protein
MSVECIDDGCNCTSVGISLFVMVQSDKFCTGFIVDNTLCLFDQLKHQFVDGEENERRRPE